MKRIIFIVLILLSGLSFAQNTLPVIPFGDRKADLYYWDTNWYDQYEHINPNISIYPGKFYHYFPIGAADMYIGRACVTATPILVRGIAGVMHLEKRTGSIHFITYLDTTISGRVTEQFKLYNSNYELLGEVDVDQYNPSYKMDFRDGNKRDTFNVYEVYFDKPVLVSGQFYVGGTSHNNMVYGYHSELLGVPWEHMIHTFYPGFIGRNQYSSSSYMKDPYPMEVLYKYYSPYQYTHPLSDATYGTYLYDTSAAYTVPDWPWFLPFFAIIDTNYVYYDCQQPTGLRVEYADEDSVVVAWNNASAEMWDVMVWPDGIEPDSGMHFTVQTNRLTMYGLDISQNYNIKVMSVCDTFHCNTSDWSSVFQMRVCDHIVCPVPDGLIAEPLAGDGRVIVVWNHMDVDLYELAIWNDNENEDSATLIQSTLEYVMLDDLDTALWYNAKIRSGCDECGNISEWSDTVRFYVPNLHPDSGDTTAINDVVARHTHLMPNPTSDRVTVVSSYQLQKVELFGTDGKLIVSFDTNGLSAEIDLSAYPSGTYIVRIGTNAGVATKRLVKR